VKTIHAFILAAGYGERLRPITDHIPKPLLPIMGKPVIELVLERITRLPVDSFGINIHHKPEMLIQWAGASQYADKIELFQEKAILGTGGALRNAAKFLGSSAFILHNADILSDISLETLVEKHFSSGNTVTLAVHDHEKFNNLWIDSSGILRNVGRGGRESTAGLCKIAFTGIALYSPDFLDLLPEGNSSVVDAWLMALASGRKIGTVDFSGCSWTDIGTPAAYASAVFEALEKSGETIYAHASADCSKAEIEGFADFESGCVIGSGTYLKNCIVLPEARITDGSSIEDALVGPDYVIRLEKEKRAAAPVYLSEDMGERFFRGSSKVREFRLIGTGGSDRKYYRLRNQGKSAVLMVCSPDDPDYERHITYTAFFLRHSLPVPEMLEADEAKKQALFEDLGDLSLYAWLKCRREPEMIEGMYRKVMDILVKLHTGVSRDSADCPLLASRVFGYEHLRWETGYFAERFVSGLLGITISDERKLGEDFHRLAESVAAFPKAVVHRDFQSQNIMVTRNGLPHVIDYQGARMGPPAYDLASVLWDPYYRLDEAMQERLITYYLEARKTASSHSLNEAAFRHSLLLCRLQRHMQALGAYGFLSRVKGKRYFLKHIPQALEYLSEEIARAADYPALHELIGKINAKENEF
jgi:NDP-sugar pyrophosphorylase family protein/aminoglycoside/choline kinase family phosphotransferase